MPSIQEDKDSAPAELSTADRSRLLELAHQAVRHDASEGRPIHLELADLPESLREERAAFVCVYIDGFVRGCTGELEARRSLAECVASHACSAAFLDHRAPPVEDRELAHMNFQISVLDKPEPIEFHDEDDLVRQLRPLEDGLIIESAGHVATFLPQVWESIPEPEEFLRHLKRKAGLPSTPLPELKAWRYGAEVFADSLLVGD